MSNQQDMTSTVAAELLTKYPSFAALAPPPRHHHRQAPIDHIVRAAEESVGSTPQTTATPAQVPDSYGFVESEAPANEPPPEIVHAIEEQNAAATTVAERIQEEPSEHQAADASAAAPVTPLPVVEEAALLLVVEEEAMLPMVEREAPILPLPVAAAAMVVEPPVILENMPNIQPMDAVRELNDMPVPADDKDITLLPLPRHGSVSNQGTMNTALILAHAAQRMSAPGQVFPLQTSIVLRPAGTEYAMDFVPFVAHLKGPDPTTTITDGDKSKAMFELELRGAGSSSMVYELTQHPSRSVVGVLPVALKVTPWISIRVSTGETMSQLLSRRLGLSSADERLMVLSSLLQLNAHLPDFQKWAQAHEGQDAFDYKFTDTDRWVHLPGLHNNRCHWSNRDTLPEGDATVSECLVCSPAIVETMISAMTGKMYWAGVTPHFLMWYGFFGTQDAVFAMEELGEMNMVEWAKQESQRGGVTANPLPARSLLALITQMIHTLWVLHTKCRVAHLDSRMRHIVFALADKQTFAGKSMKNSAWAYTVTPNMALRLPVLFGNLYVPKLVDFDRSIIWATKEQVSGPGPSDNSEKEQLMMVRSAESRAYHGLDAAAGNDVMHLLVDMWHHRKLLTAVFQQAEEVLSDVAGLCVTKLVPGHTLIIDWGMWTMRQNSTKDRTMRMYLRELGVQALKSEFSAWKETNLAPSVHSLLTERHPVRDQQATERGDVYENPIIATFAIPFESKEDNVPAVMPIL